MMSQGKFNLDRIRQRVPLEQQRADKVHPRIHFLNQRSKYGDFRMDCTGNPLSRQRSRVGPLMAVFLVLFIAMPEIAAAQAVQQRERLNQAIGKLEDCVRTYLPSAEASGVLTTKEAVEYFAAICKSSLDGLASIDVGAIPPGMVRNAIVRTWKAFIEEKRVR